MAEPALVLPPAGPSLAGDGGGLTDLAAFPVLRPVTPRYSDLGGDRRVTTVALTRWLEEARVQAELPRFRALVQDGGGRFRIVLAAQRLRALAPVPRGAEYRIGLGVRRIGGSSFSYGYGVFAGDRCVAVGDSVTVVATGSGPSELPDELRADLASMVIDEPGGAAAPRPEPARRDRTRYPAVHRLTSRIGDVDTNRHVNNVAILSWYADAVAAWQSGPPRRPRRRAARGAGGDRVGGAVRRRGRPPADLRRRARRRRRGGRPALPGRPVLRRAVRGARRRLRRRRAARPDRRRAPAVMRTLIGTHDVPWTLDPS